MYRIKFILLLIFNYVIQANAYNKAADSLLSELKKAFPDSIQVKILIQLSADNQIGKDSTLIFAKKASELAWKTKSNSLTTKAEIVLGKWYLGNSKSIDTSLIIWHNLFNKMKAENYVYGMAQANRYLGKAFLFNTLDSAIYYNLKSIELFKSINDSDMVNSVKINLAVVYAQADNFTEGIRLTKEALEFFERNGNYFDAGTAALNIGIFYDQTGDYKNGAEYVRKSIYFNKIRGDSIGTAHGKATLADILVLEKKYDEAKSNYLSVLETGKKINSQFLMNTGYIGLADIALANENWGEAIENLNQTVNYSGNSEAIKELYYERLYKAYRGAGNYLKAMDNYILYIAARDSFNSAERLKAVDEMEAKYENKEKQSQIDLLNKEKQIQENEAGTQKIIRNVIIVFFILITALGVLLFNRFKLQKRIESQQALLSERKRISSELHDDLGAQLSTARMFISNLKNNTDENASNSLIENSLKLIDSSINDLRKIMDDLQTSTLQEEGFVAAAEELVNKINHINQIKFTLTHHETGKRFDKKIEHNLFRITQELISNTLKYAEAKNVSIDLIKRDEKIILMYEDDGKGFDMNQVNRGYGLSNIESRVESVHGSVEFDSKEGKGSRTIIELPLLYAEANA